MSVRLFSKTRSLFFSSYSTATATAAIKNTTADSSRNAITPMNAVYSISRMATRRNYHHSSLMNWRTSQSTTTLQFQKRHYSGELDPANKSDYDAYVSEWMSHFSNCEDDFELERGLNHIFAQDWAPSVELIAEALKAARRMDTFATAVRILEGLENKVHNKAQYDQYLKVLQPLLDELGVVDKHALGEFKPVRQKVWWADA